MKTSTTVLLIAAVLLVSSLFNVENFMENDTTATASSGNAITGFSVVDGNASKMVVGVSLIVAVGLFGWFFIIKQTEASLQ